MIYKTELGREVTVYLPTYLGTLTSGPVRSGLQLKQSPGLRLSEKYQPTSGSYLVGS